jgi:tRNA (guanosine-2'-O-)-methyltransferase
MNDARKKRLEQVAKNRQRGLTVVFEDLHDPHNVGAVIRTCDAFGIQKVYLIFEKEKPFDPGKIGKGSSSTANKWLDYEMHLSTEECLVSLKNDGYTLVATALTDNTKSIYDAKFTDKKIALLVGNEYTGLSKSALKHAQKTLYIPMRGMIQSLNVSVATGIFLYEITRQRMQKGALQGFTKNEIQRMIEDFSRR